MLRTEVVSGTVNMKKSVNKLQREEKKIQDIKMTSQEDKLVFMIIYRE